MHTPNASEINRNGVHTFLRGRPEDPPWARPALLALLMLTAIAYIWGLDNSGWANTFYSAAVQAATKSWKAFFFGSFDAANFITVDKPPAALWIMDLSARIFGLSSWSILVPEALEGVTCVWVLYSTVRRWFSPAAALLAGAVLAMTPVAALMFRFNNPDALLVLLLTASAYFLTRALEDGKAKWLLCGSVLIGVGFLTKMLAAFLIIPGFVLVYLLFAPVPMRRRLWQILMSAVTVVISAGWWVAIVQLTPAADRPYIGSSQNNSLLNLIFGYNGFGRLTGQESGGLGGTNGFSGLAGGGLFGGSTGLTRLFDPEMGGQISWLIPAALILLVVAIWTARRNWRSDRTVPALILWAAALIVSGLTFSFGSGIIHTYYTVALAPASGALVGIGTDVLWRRRDELTARVGLGVASLATAIWSFVLLDRTPAWLPWLRASVLVIGGVATVAIMFGTRLSRNLNRVTAMAALVAGLAGPFAYTIQTVGTPHTGPIPTAGPVGGGSGGGTVPGGFGRFKGGTFPGGVPGSSGNVSGRAPGPGGNFPGGSSGSEAFPGAPDGTRGIFPGGAGGLGGLNATPSTAILSLLSKDASHYTWAAATIGASSAASYQLATGDPVMDIGGFTGSDPAPTLGQFKHYVGEGKIHYFIAGGMGFGGGFKARGDRFPGAKTRESNLLGGIPGGGASTGTAITQWVEQHFKAITVGRITVYNLIQPK